MAAKKVTMSSAADRSLRGINLCWLFFVLVLDGISRLVLVIDR
jgi:hypothetical protein